MFHWPVPQLINVLYVCVYVCMFCKGKYVLWQIMRVIHVWNGLDQPSHCLAKKCIPIDFNVIFCKAHPSPIGMCTNPSRDKDDSIFPTLMPNLIMYQNTCFAIQASLYSTLYQKWNGSMRHVVVVARGVCLGLLSPVWPAPPCHSLLLLTGLGGRG